MKVAAMGTNTLLVGATGTGKTYSIRSLVEAGLETFCIFTEPGMASVLGDIPCSKGLHWVYIPPANPSWDSMIDTARKINTLSFESLTKLKDINKRDYAQLLDVYAACNNFTCDRCGEQFGCVDSWDTSRALVVDSLSGLNIMAMSMVVGAKPVKSQADWGVAMGHLETLLQKWCTGSKCHFVMTAHLEREMDEVTGGIQLMASTLGRKLAPKVPRFFDDVINVQRNGTAFSWSTAAVNIDLKARNLPIADNLEPSFRLLLENWRKKTEGGEAAA